MYTCSFFHGFRLDILYVTAVRAFVQVLGSGVRGSAFKVMVFRTYFEALQAFKSKWVQKLLRTRGFGLML